MTTREAAAVFVATVALLVSPRLGAGVCITSLVFVVGDVSYRPWQRGSEPRFRAGLPGRGEAPDRCANSQGTIVWP